MYLGAGGGANSHQNGDSPPSPKLVEKRVVDLILKNFSRYFLNGKPERVRGASGDKRHIITLRCFGDMRTSGGPIVSLFYSLFPIITAVIITVCYVGIWITIKVSQL